MRNAVCVLVKNERRHIAEWVAYQFALGFDTVIALDNNSSDGTGDFLRKLGRLRDVRVIDWQSHETSTQSSGYEHVCRLFSGEFDWIGFIDSDEFIAPTNNLALHDLLDRHQNHSAIALNWLIFGSSGHVDFPRGLIVESFVSRGAHSFAIGEQLYIPNRHVKSIIRPQHVIRCGNPHFFFMDVHYFDALGRLIEWSETPGITSSVREDCDWFVQHYFVRSRAHWREKIDRGYFDGTKRSEQEFVWHDRNEIIDRSALRFLPDVKRILTEFAEVQD